ncbi:antitoxin [Glaesserella parasuis]|uniref:antitoxin n=1 Tax=Glaesserella parasuis TaxID=738 RepID=UPI00094F6A4A|nr:antitoxin [Glaesserella parasuis]MCT8782039.1 antitoxin [Glaesserella parasuis]MDG6854059.1 antitoxin [Glaesserella parasuis]MDO9671671.1 antitoxin [Glaesserella parasuis]MDO9689514.1 antitoxin [Glaesserella parasuis]MDP0313540.1 antitoxin [Glaesserella parasuis]
MEKVEKSPNPVLNLSLANQKLILECLEHPKEPNLVMLEALKMHSLYFAKTSTK